MTLIKLAKYEPGIFNPMDFSEGVGASDYAIDTAAFQGTAAQVCAYGSGGRFQIPSGTFMLNKTTRFDVNGIEIMGRGMWATQLQFAPGSNVTTGYGSVKATAGVASFMSRPGHRIADGDRIIVGSNEYVLSSVAITPAENAAVVVALSGTVSRAANVATFSASQASVIENGSFLVISGVGYIVSAFNGTTTATLLTTSGGNATFANGVTAEVYYTVATITSITGSTTFAPSAYSIPETAVFRLQRATSLTALGDVPVASFLNVTGMGFIGADDNQKIAFDCYDMSRVRLRDIYVPSSFVGNKRASANASTLTPSIGVRVTGREMVTLDNVVLYTDRPVHCRAMAAAIDTSVDHFHFTDVLLGIQVATESGIVFDGEAKGGNIIFDGQSSINGGTNGIWHKPNVTGSSLGAIEIGNLRYEQPAVNTGYAVRWEAYTQQLLFRNVWAGGAPDAIDNNGWKLKACKKVTFLNCTYNGTLEALNVDNGCDDIHFRNTFTQVGSTSNLAAAGFEEVDGDPVIASGQPFAPSSTWMRYNSGDNTASRVRSRRLNGMNIDGRVMAMVPREQYTLPMSLSGGLTSGTVEMTGGWARDIVGTVSSSGTTLTFSTAQTDVGTGTITATVGAATFSVTQVGMANGNLITAGATTYTLSAYDADAKTGTLSGAPTFGASAFTRNFIQIGDEILNKNTVTRYSVSALISNTQLTVTTSQTVAAIADWTVGLFASGRFEVGGIGARKVDTGGGTQVGDGVGGLGLLWLARAAVTVINTSLHTLKVTIKTQWTE